MEGSLKDLIDNIGFLFLFLFFVFCFLFNATELNKTWSFTSSTGGILWSLLVRLLRFVPKGASNRTCGSRLGRRLVISS